MLSMLLFERITTSYQILSCTVNKYHSLSKVALKRAPSELASYQKKIIPLDTHVGVSFAGLTADAKSLSR